MEDRRERTQSGPGPTQLVLYSQTAGVGSVFRANGEGKAFDLVYQHENWSKFWDIIVPGKFGGTSGQDDLLFYTRTGSGSFFQINTDGTLQLIKTNQGWAKTWSNIVAIKDKPSFADSSNGQDRLLFYDRTNCVGFFFKVNQGTVTPIGEPQRGWAQWDNIVALDIGLLFYRYPGQCCLYALDAQCKPQFMKKYDFGNFDWNCITTGRFSVQSSDRNRSPTSDVLLYERKSGAAAMYTFNDKGEIVRSIFEQQNWAKGWTFIVAGTFQPPQGVSKVADLFCFDCVISKGASFGDNGQNVLARLSLEDKAWSHVVAVTSYQSREPPIKSPLTGSKGTSPRKVEVIDVDMLSVPIDGEASEQVRPLRERVLLMERENAALAEENRTLKKERDEVWQSLQRMQGNKLDGLSLEQLESLEEELFGAMKKVTAKKAECVVQEKEAEKKLCVICMDKARDIVFVDCSHLCCCQGCSEKLTSCPLCRKTVTSKLKVFDINN